MSMNDPTLSVNLYYIFLRENLQDKENMSNFAHEFLKLLSYKDIK